jgi:lysozyme
MSTIVPPKRPLQSRSETEAKLTAAGVVQQVALLGDRGYYLNGMGEPGKNDRGIYDDALFLLSPAVHASFNANTDPSVYRSGIATLKPGRWLYKLGIHGLSRPKAQQYRALVQAAEVTVARDGQEDDTGWFGINIHRGAYQSTSSLGCQTIFPDQWTAFFSLVESEMKRFGQKTIPYVLLS